MIPAAFHSLQHTTTTYSFHSDLREIWKKWLDFKENVASKEKWKKQLDFFCWSFLNIVVEYAHIYEFQIFSEISKNYIPVISHWPKSGVSAVKQTKARMRRTMKIG